MAELLAMSPSAYARPECNETKVAIEELPRISEKLKIPMQDLLPELLTVHNSPTGNANGIVFNNINNNYYYSTTYTTRELELKIQALEKELGGLRGKDA